MIQRIQSLYLLIGALLLSLFFVFDAPWSSAAAETYGWFEPALLGAIGATAGLALVSLFLYSRLPVQRTLVVVVQGLTIVLAATLYGGLFLSGELSVQSPDGLNMAKATVLIVPAVTYVLFMLARRGIERDIKIIEDQNSFRLRD